MTVVDLSDMRYFDRRNLFQPDARTIAVRPGLRRLFAPLFGGRFVGGKTVKSPSSGQTNHYVVEAVDSTSPQVIVYHCDEDLNIRGSLPLSGYRPPRVVTFAQLGQELMICSPDLPTLRCIVGGWMEIADIVVSANDINTTTIDKIPRGVGVVWKDRLVIGAQAQQDTSGALFVSDPGAPRSFVGVNTLPGPWSSPIHGLHVAPDGGLLVMTETGVWAVPDGVVSTGQQLQPRDIVPVSGLNTYNFGQSADVRGTVWALTRRGLRQAYPDTDADILLDEQAIPRDIDARIAALDYRSGGTACGSDLGPMVGFEGSLWLLDLQTGHRGWWTSATLDLTPKGMMHEPTGEELLLTPSGVFRVGGNFDGDLAHTSELGSQPVGYFAGTVATGPAEDFTTTTTKIKVAGDGLAYHGLNGHVVSQPVPQDGARQGTEVWEDTTTLSDQLLEQSTAKPSRARSAKWELALEVGVSNPLSRILPLADIDGQRHTSARDRGQ